VEFEVRVCRKVSALPITNYDKMSLREQFAYDMGKYVKWVVVSYCLVCARLKDLFDVVNGGGRVGFWRTKFGELIDFAWRLT